MRTQMISTLAIASALLIGSVVATSAKPSNGRLKIGLWSDTTAACRAAKNHELDPAGLTAAISPNAMNRWEVACKMGPAVRAGKYLERKLACKNIEGIVWTEKMRIISPTKIRMSSSLEPSWIMRFCKP